MFLGCAQAAAWMHHARNYFSQQAWYFQFRVLPSAIHATAWTMREARVASRLASKTQSTYSRCCAAVKQSKRMRAPARDSRAAAKSSGTDGASRVPRGAGGAAALSSFSAS
jgi:hypothetical protein